MHEEKTLVGVLMGSSSDYELMRPCMEMLDGFKISYEVHILSAHRTPNETREYALRAAQRGIEIIIAGAGWAAHLAGMLASYTLLPVIGIPIDSSPLKGIDSLLSICQMPPGIPVATVSVGKAGVINAAILAAEILGIKYPEFQERLRKYRDELRNKVINPENK